MIKIPSPTCSFEVDIPPDLLPNIPWLRVDAWLSPGEPQTRWEPGEPAHADGMRCYDEHGNEVTNQVVVNIKLWDWLEVQAFAHASTGEEDYRDC